MDLLDVLGHGPDEAKTRRELVDILRIEDRLIRLEISNLRKQGCPIVNFGKGYYITNDKMELVKFIATEYHSRIKDMQETMNGLLNNDDWREILECSYQSN